jgi:GNAT superfamily N-acetyltransferase
MTKPVTSAPTITLQVRRLEASNVADYRELRLESLKVHPEAFGSSLEYEGEKPISWWAERLETSTVFGGWVNNSPLVGITGFAVEDGVKLRHKGVLWGMYVRPKAPGLAAALVQQVVAHARTLVEQVSLTVVVSNGAARRLYSAVGFEEYGLGAAGPESRERILRRSPDGPPTKPTP